MPTSDPNCPFCKIVQGNDLEAREVYRDEHVVAFFPTDPAVLGHVLIIPRNHVDDIYSLGSSDAGYLAQASLHVSSALRTALAPDGLNIIQSNGEAATQSVGHLHVHIVPRWTSDAMGPIWPERTDFSEAQKDQILHHVRSAAQQQRWLRRPQIDPEDRRKHLDYIQAVVTRQSAASASAKSWLLPIVTATFGFALAQKSWPLAVLGLVAIVLFAYLDANYLRSEKRFRRLYNTVAHSQRVVPNFTLDPADADDPPERMRETWRQAFARSYLPEWNVWKSWSILPFYVALFILGIGVLLVAGGVWLSEPTTALTDCNG